MKTFYIEIEAKTDGDAETALQEVTRLIESGCLAGMNSNESGGFSFTSSGDYEREEWCDECHCPKDDCQCDTETR